MSETYRLVAVRDLVYDGARVSRRTPFKASGEDALRLFCAGHARASDEPTHARLVAATRTMLRSGALAQSPLRMTGAPGRF